MITKLLAASACVAALAAAWGAGRSLAANGRAHPIALRVSIPISAAERSGHAWASTAVGDTRWSLAVVWGKREEGGRVDLLLAREVTAASAGTPERPSRGQVTGS